MTGVVLISETSVINQRLIAIILSLLIIPVIYSDAEPVLDKEALDLVKHMILFTEFQILNFCSATLLQSLFLM